jgi:hypothetical protein
VTILLLILEIVGRVIYPYDIDARGLLKAERDPRLPLSYLSLAVDGKTILHDIHRLPRRYIPFLGWIGSPDIELPTISTNSIGFRDGPIEKRKPGERRVLILGGSTAWGLGASSNEHTVASTLESLLNEGTEGHVYRVMSGAYLGWQSRNELIALMEYHDRFDPDFVIVLTGYNDLYSLTFGRDRELHMRPESRMLANAVDKSLRPMSTARAIRKVAGSLGIWRIIVYFKERAALGTPKGGTVRYEAEVANRVIPDIVDRYVSMASYAQRHGSELIIAVQPDIFTSGKPLAEQEAGVRQRFTERWEHIAETYAKYRSDLYGQLQESLASGGTKVIDLALDTVDAPVFLDACHLNDHGYLQLGRSILEGIEDRLIEPP